MKLGKNISYTFDLILIFLFIYAPTLVFIPFALSKFVLFFLIIITFLDKNLLNENIRILGKGLFLRFYFSISIVVVCYFLLLTIFAKQYNLVFVQQTFWLLSEGVFGSIMLYNYLIRKYNQMKVFRMLLGIITFQSIVVIISFLYSPLRDLINTILLVTDERHVTSYRMRGLSNGGGAGLSYVQALGVLISAFLIINDKRKRNFYLFCAIIITISQIFIARTGLIFSFLLLLATIFQESFNNNSIAKLIKQIVIGTILIFTVYNVAFSLMSEQVKVVFEDRVLNRAFEFYYNYETSGSLETNSTNVLKDMYILPDSDLGLLFGEGIWDSAGQSEKTLIFGREVDSDVGFIRMIFAFGIILTTLYYFSYIIYLKDIYESPNGRIIVLILLSLLVIFILGETKEPFLIRMSGTNKILILIYLLMVINPLQIIKNQKNK